MMNLNEFSQRFKRTTAPGQDPLHGLDTQQAHEEAFRIRAKMIGVLLRDARVTMERTHEDCGRFLRVASEMVEAWEWGDQTPSLPQLELLAHYLDVPVSHFWNTNTLDANPAENPRIQDQYLLLRDRMIGALLRQAREEEAMSLQELAEASGIAAAAIDAYEWGEMPLPMHELTVLANGVKKNLQYFLESSSHIGELLAMRESWKHFAQLPDDIRQFAANPLNIGFIEIALLLSQMPTDRLRRVGESVLNITM